MKPGVISATICALASVGVAVLSADILGPGLWGGVMLACGLFIGVSPHVGALRLAGAIVSLLLAIIGFAAAALGLLAATIGGSFNLPGDQAALLALFVIAAMAGVFVFRARPR